MATYILALDQGTTSSRAILFDRNGHPVARAQRELTQHFPQSGWVEHDPLEIWHSQLDTLHQALASVGASPRDIAAIGIANQRETSLVWERATGKPLAPAIVWQDRRTAAHCAQLQAEGHEEQVRRRTGLLLDPYFSATKLAWLLDAIPHGRERAQAGELAAGTIDSWLIWKLSDGARHVTDATNASRTLLLDIDTGQWDPAMLALFDIPLPCLPQVVPSGTRGEPIALATALGHPVPITGVAGDQQAALFGQTCFVPGMAKNTYGTGCFVLMQTGDRRIHSSNRLLTTIASHTQERRYALEGSVFVGGAVVQWLRDGLGMIERAEDVEALAASVPDHGDVHVVPAFAGLGSPHWDPYARGAIVGLSRGSTRAHIARAALESIAFQSAELLQAMQADVGHPLTELRVDGGASANNLLMQFQSDLLGVPVVRPRCTETTALGAAYLAGLSAGYWESTGELAGNWQVDRVFEPAMSRDEAGGRLHTWARAVERSRGWTRADA
ncbi:glycerol kinase GlpK [Tahibacter amnicola]|uniref:Glycerol kinase n=1 Tax=Tahibacter amnicola TaxID=2976241 RepID=A0ABY6BEA4_9GAMM|nr:glycerol kinase GlpK [Tahibacter amnicola]UXI68079.1 glycerol kinase GlpK [Tahibacter amnicola]